MYGYRYDPQRISWAYHLRPGLRIERVTTGDVQGELKILPLVVATAPWRDYDSHLKMWVRLPNWQIEALWLSWYGVYGSSRKRRYITEGGHSVLDYPYLRYALY